MAIVKATVKLDWITNSVAGPSSSNTYYFDSGVSTPSAVLIADVYDALLALYGTDLAGVFGSTLASGQGQVSFLNLSDATPREAFSFAPIGVAPEADSLPTEATLRVKFGAATAPNVRRSRGKGSVNLGPLAVATIDAGGHITGAILEQVADAYETFATAVNADPNYTWVAGSEQYGFEPVVGVQVVNEPGTIRRRQNTLTASESRAI